MILTVTFACIFFHVIYAWGVGRIYIYVCVCMSRQVLTRNMIMYEYSTQVHSLWYNEYIRIYLYLFLKCYVYIYILYICMHAVCILHTHKQFNRYTIHICGIYAHVYNWPKHPVDRLWTAFRQVSRRFGGNLEQWVWSSASGRREVRHI